MAKACLNHKDRPSVAMCHQCHAPICRSCTTVTPHGSFCSPECSVRNRDFKERLRSGEIKAGGGLALKVFGALLLVIVLMAGIHFAAVKGWPAAKAVDLVGRLLDQAGSLKPGDSR